MPATGLLVSESGHFVSSCKIIHFVDNITHEAGQLLSLPHDQECW